MQRRKSPILAFRKEWIGRRSAADIGYENLVLAPGIEPIGMHSERHVEIKNSRSAAQTVDLLLRTPLNEHVILLRSNIVIARAKVPLPQPLRPLAPALVQPFGYRAKGSILTEFRAGFEKPFKLIAP